MYCRLIITGIILSIAYNYEQVSTFVKSKYNKWLNLNDMVSTQYKKADNNLNDALDFYEKKDIIKDRIMIKIVSIKIILTSFYLNLLEHYNYIFGTKIRKIDKNKYYGK